MGQSRTGVAQGSALASHDSSADPRGSRAYVIRGPNNHVNELAWAGFGWNTTDLNYTTGALPAIAGSALHSHDSGASRVYFIGSDNHVHELAWYLNPQGQWVWNTTDLTATAKDANDNAPPSAIADSALASHDSGGSRVYFIGKDPTSGDDHVYEIAWLGSIWNYTPLTTVTGAPSAIAGSALASHDSGGSRVYFIGNDNHVHELAWANQQGQWLWNTTDLTSVARDIHSNPPPPAIAGSALTSHNTSADPGGAGCTLSVATITATITCTRSPGRCRLVGTPPT